MKENEKYAYVTLLGTDDYVIGALCLEVSLKRVGSKHPLIVLCSKNILKATIDLLKRRGIRCRALTHNVSIGKINTGVFERWNYTFDKLQVFGLIEYKKVVFLDSDMYVVKNMDHLFEKPHMSSVYADVWDKTAAVGLNSGLMVLEPSKKEYEGLVRLLHSDRFANSTMFGDQDVIRAYYSDWIQKTECRLPVGYNLYYPFVNEYLRQSKADDIFNIHFVYDKKPWQFSFPALLRRLRKFHKSYLIRYMALVYRFRLLIWLYGIGFRSDGK